jgi:hypothetical protein
MENLTEVSASDSASAVGNVDNIRADAGGNRTKATPDLTFVKGNVVLVRGWIAKSITAPTIGQRVRVIVDGAHEAQVQSNVLRNDVAGALGAGNLLHAGFIAAISTARLERGRHAIAVSVGENEDDDYVDIPTSCNFVVDDAVELIPSLGTCEPRRLSGNIDTWTALPRTNSEGNAEVDVFVRGWACDLETRTPVADVFGKADQLHVARAIMGFPRPDVAEWLGSPTFEGCGFRLRMVLPATLANDGAIELIAISGDHALRGPILPSKSVPRMPKFFSKANDTVGPSQINVSAHERAVLDDVLEFDLMHDRRLGLM